jgi:hypothetical protein
MFLDFANSFFIVIGSLFSDNFANVWNHRLHQEAAAVLQVGLLVINTTSILFR